MLSPECWRERAAKYKAETGHNASAGVSCRTCGLVIAASADGVTAGANVPNTCQCEDRPVFLAEDLAVIHGITGYTYKNPVYDGKEVSVG